MTIYGRGAECKELNLQVMEMQKMENGRKYYCCRHGMLSKKNKEQRLSGKIQRLVLLGDSVRYWQAKRT